MKPRSLLAEHHQLCSELHQLALAENRFLRSQQRAPDDELLSRKRALLEQLNLSVEALRAQPAASARDSESRAQLDSTRARILQILQLDKENEQLLLRCSLARNPALFTPPPAASASLLREIYSRVG